MGSFADYGNIVSESWKMEIQAEAGKGVRRAE